MKTSLTLLGLFSLPLLIASVACSGNADSASDESAGSPGTDDSAAGGPSKKGAGAQPGTDCTCALSINGEKKTLRCGDEPICVSDSTYTCGADAKLSHTPGCDEDVPPPSSTANDAGTKSSKDAGSPPPTGTKDAGPASPPPTVTFGGTFKVNGKTVSCKTVDKPLDIGEYVTRMSKCNDGSTLDVTTKSLDVNSTCNGQNNIVVTSSTNKQTSFFSGCTIKASRDLFNGVFSGSVSGSTISGTFVGPL